MSGRNGFDVDGAVCAAEVSWGEVTFFEPVNMIVEKVKVKIEIDGTPEQREILLKTIDNCFTAREKKALVEKGGLLICVE